MIDFTLKELAAISGGTLVGGDAAVHAVSTDSRKCKGALFVALKGGKFDGHDFIGKAVAGGAKALLVSRPVEAPGVPCVICTDTLRGLGLCGALVRSKCKAKVASLTGSCGKTTVKELCSSILSQCGSTIATSGNFNNDVGVPLTLLRLEEGTKYAVIEQGASHLGDIRRTCEFVKAGTALINNGTLVPNSELGHIIIDGKGDAEKYAADSIRTKEELNWKKWGKRLTKYYKLLEFYLSPDVFVVGGGVSKKHEKFFPYIEIDTPIIPAALLNTAGIVGAAQFAAMQ